MSSTPTAVGPTTSNATKRDHPRIIAQKNTSKTQQKTFQIMKTNIDTIAAFISAVIWADGINDDTEKNAVEEIADALELDEAAFKTAIDDNIKKFDTMNKEETKEFLRLASKQVNDEEIGILFEAAMQVAITDNKLSLSEVGNIMLIAEVLGIETDMAILMLADVVKSEPKLEISFDD